MLKAICVTAAQRLNVLLFCLTSHQFLFYVLCIYPAILWCIGGVRIAFLCKISALCQVTMTLNKASKSVKRNV